MKNQRHNNFKNNEIYLENILAHLPGSLFWKDINGVYLGCNDYAATIAGLPSREAVIGKTDYDMPWKEQADTFRANDQIVITTGQPLEVEEAAVLANGLLTTFLSKKAPLFDDNNKIIGILGTAIDITELKHQEEELRKAKEKMEFEGRTTALYLKNIVASLPGSIYWKDVNGVYLGCNDFVAIRMAGLNSPAEALGKTDYDFPWKDHADEWRANDQEVMRTGIRTTVEEIATLADGSQIIELTNKAPLRDEAGNIIGTIGASLDITDRKKFETQLQEAKEKAEQANEAKSNFLATMSHELRTPLNAILGMAQVLSSKEMTPELQDYVHVIQISGKNLLTLINDILDFSKLEAGMLNIKSAEFDIHRLLYEVIASMRYQAEQKGIKLQLEQPEDLPQRIIGDSLRIRQVLINLISNAVKFTEHGFIKLIIKMDQITAQQVKIYMAVKDTGIGIPADKLNYVFERFTQVDSSYGRQYGGAGLGLSICKQLVEAMQGKIGAQSEVNKGSVFWFEVPLTLIDSEIEENEAEVPLEELVNLSHLNCRILLVEDNPLNQRVVKIMLAELGCTLVDIAPDGEEAIKLFKNNSYSLVFMDIGLPSMDGFTVTRELRKLEANAKKTPIIALTAHVFEEDREKCMAAGANGVLAKPIMQPQLNKILKDWVLNT